jgi:endonuclease G
MKGYNPSFLGRRKKLKVVLPAISDSNRPFIAPVKNQNDHILHYPNYSVVQHAKRRLPFYTACNIDGSLYQSIRRKDLFKGGRDKWRKDRRIAYQHQWGGELYSAPKSDFDKGHMVKREDVQWGKDIDSAKEGARGTFYYTNATPQHPDVNRAIWKEIEDYILHEETLNFDLKICSFTGPVLRDDDPVFVSSVRGTEVKIPSLFWKVIYFTKDKKTVQRVAFLVGQLSLLESNEIVHPVIFDRDTDADTYFLDFDMADTYQVKTQFIESLTDLKFAPGEDSYQDMRAMKLVLEEVNVRGEKGMFKKVKGLVL